MGQTGVLILFFVLAFISFIIAFRGFECIRMSKEIIVSLERQSDLPCGLPYRSDWVNKITDFVFLAFTSFIITFLGFECIGR